MCIYCEQEKIDDINVEFTKKVIFPKNKPILTNPIIKIDLCLNGKYVLTNGLQSIEIKRCPICERKLSNNKE